MQKTSTAILLAAVVATTASAETYTVKRGDTMYSIARAYGISYTELRNENPKITHPGKIYVGQKISVGGTAPTPVITRTVHTECDGGAAVYTVKRGDTMKNIAATHNTTWQDISAMNAKVRNPNRIYPGQRLSVGCRVVPAFAKAPAGKPAPVVVHNAPPIKEIKTWDNNAACKNVINGNPLYRPAQRRWYSVTDFSTNTSFKPFALHEEFGYGITDRLSIFLDTYASTSNQFKTGTNAWNYFGGGLSWRYLDRGAWKADAYGKVRAVANRRGATDWWHNDTNAYSWAVGTKLGYSTCWWTLNGLFEYDYANTEAFNWNTLPSLKNYTAGLEMQVVFNHRWNMIARVVYNMPQYAENGFGGKLGLNYNFTPHTYLGAYVGQSIASEKAGKLARDTTLGLTLGIDF
jgi:LysM repeat protein